MVAPLLGFAAAMGAAGLAKYGSSFIDDLFLQRKEKRAADAAAGLDATHDAALDELFGKGTAAAGGGSASGLLSAATPQGGGLLQDDFDPFSQAAQQNRQGAIPGGAFDQGPVAPQGLLAPSNQAAVNQGAFGPPSIGAGGDRRQTVEGALAPGTFSDRRNLGVDLLKLGGHDTLANSLITGSYKSEETYAKDQNDAKIRETERGEDRGFATTDRDLAHTRGQASTALAVTTGRESTRLSQGNAAAIDKAKTEAAIQQTLNAARKGKERTARIQGAGGVRPNDLEIANEPNSTAMVWSKNPPGSEEVYRRYADGSPIEVPQQFSPAWNEGVKALNSQFNLTRDVGRLIDLHNQYGTQNFPTKIKGEMQSTWTAAMFQVGRQLLETGAMQGDEFELTADFIQNPNGNYTDAQQAQISGSLNTVFSMLSDKMKQTVAQVEYWPGITKEAQRITTQAQARTVPFGNPSDFDDGGGDDAAAPAVAGPDPSFTSSARPRPTR